MACIKHITGSKKATVHRRFQVGHRSFLINGNINEMTGVKAPLMTGKFVVNFSHIITDFLKLHAEASADVRSNQSFN